MIDIQKLRELWEKRNSSEADYRTIKAELNKAFPELLDRMKKLEWVAEAASSVHSILVDIATRESKTSRHGQRVASDCGEAIELISNALAALDGEGK